MKRLDQRIQALLYAGAVWAAIIGAALVFEFQFNSSGPEYIAPIPGVFIGAVLLGWIPAAIVWGWRRRKN